jgi:pilus assembly protein Flp/PilA
MALLDTAIYAGHQTRRRVKEEGVTKYVVSMQNQLRELIRRVTNREEGQDMVEYALLAALISIVAIAIILLLGPYIKNLFEDVINAVNSA